MAELRKESHLPAMIETEGGPAPAAPTTAQAMDIDRRTLSDLTLKTAHVMPQLTTESAAHRLHLPHALVAELLDQLRADFLLESLGMEGPLNHRYVISARGRERVDRLLDISGYIGPAPVSLAAYNAMLEWQDARSPRVSPEEVKAALSGLVIPEETVQVAGLAISSGRSLFLSGPPGNGKTTLGHQLHNVLRGDIWIPHCIAVENNVIRLFDPHCHQVAPHAAARNQPVDRRWVKIQRPFVVAGGEMTLESLDLAYLPALRYYEAPLHMKANGGTFLIDDFGRQHVAPDELLNRWIIPLEHRIDFLTLHTGQKIQVPFLLMLIIATNLDPKDVTDPAFLRRLGYRLRLASPVPEQFVRIFDEYAAKCGVAANPVMTQRLLERYRASGRELRCCEPRDLIERVRDICRHENNPLTLNDALLDLAWAGYFGNEAAAD